MFKIASKITVIWISICFGCATLAEPVHLSLDADRCAIARALTGLPVSGCDDVKLEGVQHRGLEEVSGDFTNGYFVNFAFDSSQLDDTARAHLNRLSGVLNGNLANLCVKLVGHTDTTGAPDYNQTLSEGRANSVKLFLAGPGSVETGRLLSEGRGESAPLAGVAGTDGANRRVEILAKQRADGACS